MIDIEEDRGTFPIHLTLRKRGRCRRMACTVLFSLMYTHQKKPGALRLRLSLCLHHLPAAIHAHDADLFCRSYAVSTAGANIFAVVAVGCGSSFCFAACHITTTSPPRGEAPLNAVHLNISPALVQNELAKGVGRLGDAPPDSRVITDVQIAGSGRIAESFIMVSASAAAILYTVLHVPQVYAFMKHRSNYIFNRTVQRSRADVQFMAGGAALVPCLGNGYMTIGPRGALYGDDGFFQLSAEVFGVQRSENLFKVSCGPGSLDGLFHF